MEDDTVIDASESLNQTLKRFQSMIKQVEQRFAERERLTSQPPAQLYENVEKRSSFMSPDRVRLANEYDKIKHSIEQKQTELS